ncbi:pyrroline-5-carboxylate reductase [Geothrix sp. PMB-07]|uniref:pyrroline-5-carboxylate reductase n=1 Tax=Geothrix sp. PMB-07 TaxID=3068640 RepID=UPI00274058DF|nr:pyrroline-5-carboxylate reductase [Geothrix sp. PMB-07]WLT32234.1 pyrroline-5-carboxylate reductase [Geothrix sp. PMB-07]
MSQHPQLAIIGFGTMGQAISAGLVEASGYPAGRIHAATRHPHAARARAEALGLELTHDVDAAVRASEVVLLCVKPRELKGLLERLNATGALDHRPLVVSIAAGTTLAFLEAHTPAGTPLVRAMPNTPCAIRKGMTVLAAGQAVSEAQLAQARILFEPLGRVMDLDEKHMDAVTGLSASGPAFMFIILESLAEGGVQCGLPRAVALELAAQMTLGAASMVLETGKHPAALKDEVTTPAGCTIAGLLALEDGRIRSVVARGIERATQVAAGLG